MKTLRHEFWWWCEKRAGWLWRKLSRDRASYWLDWLPAYCYVKRHAAEEALEIT